MMQQSESNGILLKQNANRKFIASEMAEVVRDLMRAVSSDHDKGYKAARKMDNVAMLLEHCDEPLSWWDLFADAIELIKDNEHNSNSASADQEIAKAAIKYFVESTATDNAALGRTAKRLNELQGAIRCQARLNEAPTGDQQMRLALAQNGAKLFRKTQ